MPKLQQSPKVTTTVTTRQTVTLAPKTLVKLREALSGYQDLKRKADYTKAEMSMTRNKVLNIGLEDIDANNFEVDGFQIALVTDAETDKLDQDKLKKLLLAATNLSLEKLDALFARATKTTPTAAYAKITVPKERS